MTDSGRLDSFIEAERSNAVLAWLLIAFILLVFVESIWEFDLAWAGFTLVVAAITVVPPVAYRDPELMLPWEVLLVVALPLVGRALATWNPFVDLGTYLSIAALALVVAVELDVFTPVRMNQWFAIAFTVIATTATAGLWAIAEWISDLYLGTAYVLPVGSSAAADTAALYSLMWDLVAATAIGILAGVIFEWYFRRIVTRSSRFRGEP